MKCFTRAALCTLNGDASLRILSTDASDCFFTNVTFTAVAEISIGGDFFFKAIINSLSLTCCSFITFYSELTSLYISTPYTYQVWIWVRSRNCGCLVTWFCYQLIAKPGNKTATVSWPDPYRIPFMIWKLQTTFSHLSSMKVFEFQLQFHWSLFPRAQLIISQHWFR